MYVCMYVEAQLTQAKRNNSKPPGELNLCDYGLNSNNRCVFQRSDYIVAQRRPEVTSYDPAIE